MAKVVTMGEIMLRLSTFGNEKLIQADELAVQYGGGEANVAVSLTNYGHEVQFVTKVPQNAVGACAIASLRKLGVKTDFVSYGGERLGIYYLETGSAMRASSVVYDRAHSSMSEATAEDFCFEKLFEGVELFHFSGILPAISDKAALLCEEACRAAKAAGVKISCDMNYRKKLWSFSKAQRVMNRLMPYVDFFFGSAGDAKMVLMESEETAFGGSREFHKEEDALVFDRLRQEFGIRMVVSSCRRSYSASDNGLLGSLYDTEKKEMLYSKEYRITPIVDRVGGGDALTGGVLAALLSGDDARRALEFGVAASALKHTIPGDVNLVSAADVELLMQGDGSGRVQR